MENIFKKIQSFFYLLPNVLSTFFSKAVTEKYPVEKTSLTERYRGKVNIHAENCIGCRLCVLDCPAGALEMEKDSKTKFQLLHYPDRCTYCGQCEQSCRFDAIYMDNAYIPPAADKHLFFVILVDRKDEKLQSDN